MSEQFFDQNEPISFRQVDTEDALQRSGLSAGQLALLHARSQGVSGIEEFLGQAKSSDQQAGYTLGLDERARRMRYSDTRVYI